jgi:hypothetical protein
MKTESIHKKLDLQSFYSFNRLDMAEQSRMLRQNGIFVDKYAEKGDHVNLYFMNGFFAEETITSQGELKDVTAYRQGFRIVNYFDTTEVLTLKKAS